MIRPEPFTVEQQKNLAQQYRETAAWWRERGREEVAIAYETTADNLGATCPHCGGDLLVAPVNGDLAAPVEEIPLERCRDGEHTWTDVHGTTVCDVCRTVNVNRFDTP